jgi:nickel/cobalt transporter (NicO) family protein
MMDWLIVYLGQMQGGVLRTLATELRTGGLGAAALAFTLGALHALTPGHGKAALTAFFLGHEARIRKGIRVALSAALLHVISGFVAFLVLRYVIGQVASISGRGSPSFTALGYTFIILAGAIMLFQSFRPAQDHDHNHGTGALIAGMGLLPCPLTISVLGFAWVQSSGVMVAVTLVSLALGIAATIGSVALLAIAGRATLGRAFTVWLPKFEQGARIIQGLAGAVIVIVGLIMLAGIRL